MPFRRIHTTVISTKLAFLVLFVAACLFPVSGCSKPVKKKEAGEERPVVSDLNVITPDSTDNADSVSSKSDGSASKPNAAKAADEVESLPFESRDEDSATKAEEEELPALGAGG